MRKYTTSERLLLGIDPGISVMGYGLIRQRGDELCTVQYGILALQKYTSSACKLRKIFETVSTLIDVHHPCHLALEAPFYGRNVQSMLKLGRAQGMAIAAALRKQVPLTEYAPRKIKHAVTGNGNASKEQVAHMLAAVLKLSLRPNQLDASDALAVAVCHAYQR